MFKVIDNGTILVAFWVLIVGCEDGMREFWGNTATVAGGLRSAGTRVGLTTRSCAFVEDGTVDFGDDDIGVVVKVESGRRAERERVKLRLRKCSDVQV